MEKILSEVKKGMPLYISPYKEPKVWGREGIGEYWYGAEGEGKSSVARMGENTASFKDLVEAAPEEIIGLEAVRKFGKLVPLVKILTPNGRLSVQFHDKKNELWIVTGINEEITKGEATLELGFSPEAVGEYNSEVTEEYAKALNEYGKALNELISTLEASDEGQSALETTKNAEKAAEMVPSVKDKLDFFKEAEGAVEKFYGHLKVQVGDVIPVPSGTLHALGPGIEIIEPQIPGATQSLEDGATYPVRYAFPDYPVQSAKKMLDIDRTGEMHPEVCEKTLPEVIKESGGVKIERLPGNFEDKGLEVHRITLEKGAKLNVSEIKSLHNFVKVYGKANIDIGGTSFDVPQASAGGEMLIVPASAKRYGIVATEDTQIIDTFIPV